MTSDRSTNQLGGETSPYLLQHKDNPVHWRAWGEAALAEAKATGKPILLSIGYAACHWCHVMAHESFEDEATAALMNELFVNIKVDREERPDVDAIYMGALHRLGQQGGWPLTMFLDGDARPFWGGTYFPPVAQWGRPAFSDVLRRIATVYREEPAKVADNATAILTSLAARPDPGGAPELSDPLIRELVHRFAGAVDREHGGIAGAPKFPQWSFFWLLWRGAIRYGDDLAKSAVLTTLANICQGGIYDHVGGGFARYAVDERWLIPHFEKMLYDNALLIDLLVEAWRETKNPLFATRIRETVAWLEREMVAESGALAASLDADSDGEEGKFYVWTEAEIAEALGAEDAAHFARVYDVGAGGNWEGHTILNRLADLRLGEEAEEKRLAAMREKLLAARAARVRPGWDDKVLADWNGLAISALVKAGTVLDEPAWHHLAVKAFDAIVTRMTVDGRLRHSLRAGRLTGPATSADYANMIAAALRLFATTGQGRYLAFARGWVDVLERHYALSGGGLYAMTADDTADIVVRLASAADDATPNANASMASNLVALSELTGEAAHLERAEALVRAAMPDVARNPSGHAGMLAAAIDVMAPQLIVIGGAEARARTDLLHGLFELSVPGAVERIVAADDDGPLPSQLSEHPSGPAAAYVCSGKTCSAALRTSAELTAELVLRRKPI